MLARTAGLNVADADLQIIGEIPVFLTKRFDRYHDAEGRLRRILQEDLCQLMSIGREY